MCLLLGNCAVLFDVRHEGNLLFTHVCRSIQTRNVEVYSKFVRNCHGQVECHIDAAIFKKDVSHKQNDSCCYDGLGFITIDVDMIVTYNVMEVTADSKARYTELSFPSLADNPGQVNVFSRWLKIS
jgi:hypothetical protein